jgi:hypothetical protein
MSDVMSGSRGRRIAHPDWVKDAADKVASVAELYVRGSIPASIEVWMLVVPAKRLLRGVYGSDLRAAAALLRMALADLPANFGMAAWRFWRYRILMRNPDEDIERTLAALDAEDAAAARREEAEF